jgi:hypothetical protein
MFMFCLLNSEPGESDTIVIDDYIGYAFPVGVLGVAAMSVVALSESAAILRTNNEEAERATETLGGY